MLLPYEIHLYTHGLAVTQLLQHVRLNAQVLGSGVVFCHTQRVLASLQQCQSLID